MRCVYREFEGETVALWSDTIADVHKNCMSYTHLGQHGAANYEFVMKNSRPAKPEAIRALRKELLKIGYAENEC